jgi:tyrosyl-tRNA synthetase
VTLVDDLMWRGLIQDSTSPEELRQRLDGEPITFYVGFDPTAASLHAGHLMQVLTARCCSSAAPPVRSATPGSPASAP